MQTLDTDSVSVLVDAPPHDVFALVTDITRTPELSPEILRCRWIDGAIGLEVGARFEAVNKVSRGPSWKNRPVVTAVVPDREFAFSRTEKLSGTVVWRYQLEPEGTGTRVTESYQVTEPISRVGWFVIGRVFGCRDRRAELRQGMEQTLERVRRLTEREREDYGRETSTSGKASFQTGS